jgi:hypothetical protein
MASKRGGRRPGAGRPKGSVSKLTRSIKERAAVHGDDALRVLAEIMNDPEQPGAVRASAAERLLDRGFGRPDSFTEIKEEIDVNIFPEELDRIYEEGLRRSEEMQRAVEGRAERLGLKMDFVTEDGDDTEVSNF